jgi:hypothetical protein
MYTIEKVCSTDVQTSLDLEGKELCKLDMIAKFVT